MRRVNSAPHPTEAGFTVVETLAAFAILVLVLGGLFVAVSAAIGANARAGFVRTAILLANAHFAELGVAQPLATGETEGRFANGFIWQQRVTAYQSPTRPHSNPDAGVLYWIDLTVLPSVNATSRGGTYSVVTVKSAPPSRSAGGP